MSEKQDLIDRSFEYLNCDKRDPTKMVFNQDAMRKHFNFCLLSDSWNEFPHHYLQNDSIYTLHELNLGHIPVNW